MIQTDLIFKAVTMQRGVILKTTNTYKREKHMPLN